MLASLFYLLSIISRKVTPIQIMTKERTFIAVKPDGVQRGLTGEIIKRFEAKGFKLAGMKFMQASVDHLKLHYSDLSDKPFFAGLVKYMASGPLVAMCWEGTGVVKTARQMMGETKPADSKPGTIRGDFCIEVGRNIIHGSDSVESATKEINLWFKPEELVSWTQAANDWIYEFLDKLNDVSSDSGLIGLNDFLQDKSYMQGYVPSKNDLVVYSKINLSVNSKKFPHVFRWQKHIKTICAELELNLGLYGFTNKSITSTPTTTTKSTSTAPTTIKTSPTPTTSIKTTPTPTTTVKTTPTPTPPLKKETNQKKNTLKTKEVGKRVVVPHKPKPTPKCEVLSDITNGEAVTEKEMRNSTDEKDSDDHAVSSSISNTYAILLEIKPKDDDTDMNELEDLVRGVILDGMKWGASQLSPIAFSSHKLSIICTVEDNKASIQDVLQKLIKFEDYVKDVNIAAFNKL